MNTIQSQIRRLVLWLMRIATCQRCTGLMAKPSMVSPTILCDKCINEVL